MGFFLSKIIWFLVDPLLILLLGAGLGLLLYRLGHRRLGAWLSRVAMVVLALCGVLPVGQWLLTPLQDRFPPLGDLGAEVDGIIVLGGGLDLGVMGRSGMPELGASGDRLTAMVVLMRRYPEARVVYTGGSGLVLGGDTRGADAIPGILGQLGIEPSRVTLERESRNTYENAIYTRALVEPEASERWLLVTSAWHMPRSVGVFRTAGWEPIPVPVDYREDRLLKFPFRLSDRLFSLQVAITEWVGLLAYRVFGRSEAWLPGPRLLAERNRSASN